MPCCMHVVIAWWSMLLPARGLGCKWGWQLVAGRWWPAARLRADGVRAVLCPVQAPATSGCRVRVTSWLARRRCSRTHTSSSEPCRSRAGWTGAQAARCYVHTAGCAGI